VMLWMKGAEVFRVTARKDEYAEVLDTPDGKPGWICNTCRFDKKETKDWIVDGPSKIDRHSVISQNHYVLQEPAHKPLLNAVQAVPASWQLENKK